MHWLKWLVFVHLASAGGIFASSTHDVPKSTAASKTEKKSSSEKATKAPVEKITSPAVLDPKSVLTWFQGSIWALLALNVLALLIFVGTLLSTQVNAIKQKFLGMMSAIANHVKAQAAAKKEAKKLAKAKAAHEKLAAAGDVTVASVKTESDLPPPPVDLPPPPEVPEPPAAAPAPAPEAKVAATAPSAPPASSPEITEILTKPVDDEPPSQFEPPTEVYEEKEKPKVAPQAAPQPAAAPSPTPAPKPEPAPVAPAPAATPATVEAKPNAQAEAANFEKALDAALSAPTEMTEELPVFDPSAIDQALQAELNGEKPK